MKRFIALLLTLVLCISVLSVTAFAAGTGAFDVVDQEGVRGEEVVVPVKLTSNPGIAGMDITITYDDSRLEKVAYNGVDFGDGNWTIIKDAVWDAGADSTYTGTILKLTFKVKSDAPAGKAEVKVSCSAGNWDGERVTIESAKGYVTIPCDHQWSEWYETSAADCVNPGEERRDCALCGEHETKKIDALGHTPGEDYVSDDDYHWHICKVCGAECGREKHDYDIKKDGYWWCKCGQKGDKVSGGGYDDEPENGDITGHITFAAVAVIMVLTTSAVLVFKRKTAK